MTKLENVLYALNCRAIDAPSTCAECSYCIPEWNCCNSRQIMHDALDLLKKQEMRHGRWIQTKNGDFTCSLCGYTVGGEPMNYPPDGQMMLRMTGHRYCGDCGTKMDGEKEDAEVH